MTIVCLVLAVSGVVCQGPVPAPPAAVPFEVIVAFKAETPAHDLVVRAATDAELAPSALAPLIADLSGRTRVPLDLKRLASGNDVVLVVKEREVASRLLAHVRGDTRVLSAVPGEDDRDVSVAFRPSTGEARGLRRLRAGRSSPLAAKLTAAFSREFGLPLLGRLGGNGTLLLRPDTEAITTMLVERLRLCPEVEYAQPNFLLEGIREH
jgi:hypothetical protein